MGKLVEEAKDKAPNYMERFNAAHESGADMEKWVELDPPPESVKKVRRRVLTGFKVRT